MTSRRAILTGAGVVAVGGAGASWVGWRGMGSMHDYDGAVAESRAALAALPELPDFIRYATLAPSGHNTQPWLFQSHSAGIDIRPDPARRTPVVDPDDHHLFVSLGAAAENLAIATSARGNGGSVTFDPANGGSMAFRFGGATPEPSLFNAIPKRQSTRAEYDGRPVSNGELQLLARAAAVPGVDCVLITDRQQINRVRDLVIAGNTAQIGDPAFVRELKHWLRFSPHAALAHGDGLFSAASGSPALPEWLGPEAFDWVYKPATDNDKYAKQIASSAGIAVFVSAQPDAMHWNQAGRACQRFALQATALGLKHAFINQPVEVAHLRPELASLVGLPGRRPDIVMRFGHGEALPYSARRPVRDVIRT
jgi:nitroreductase